MIDKTMIQSAKETDLNTILDEFGWEVFGKGKIRCPHPAHADVNPSCVYNAKLNKYKCFSCGRAFDAIDLYTCLAEKVNGRAVPFYRAVEEVLQLDGMAGSINSSASLPCGAVRSSNNSHGNSSPYDLVLSNSRPLTGYELNYLHGRGIMLYDSYVYKGQVHTAQNIDKALLSATDHQEIQELNDIKGKGTFYEGIAPVLKKNRIQILHNYWQGVNSIIYLADFDYYNDDELQDYALFLTDMERHMAVQKTLDGQHMKKALGQSDFLWIAEGMSTFHGGDIYICEGMEDALTYTMNKKRSISLNSVNNVRSLTDYLKNDYRPFYNERFVISLDHDRSGEEATKELIQFFEAYNSQSPYKYQYRYDVCKYAEQYHDINDYWKAKVFREN